MEIILLSETVTERNYIKIEVLQKTFMKVVLPGPFSDIQDNVENLYSINQKGEKLVEFALNSQF